MKEEKCKIEKVSCKGMQPKDVFLIFKLLVTIALLSMLLYVYIV